MNNTLVGTEESAGVVLRRYSVHKMFLKIAENSEENNCIGVSF